MPNNKVDSAQVFLSRAMSSRSHAKELTDAFLGGGVVRA